MTPQLPIIDIPKEVLDRDYHGCGKVWAAMKEGKILALRYMDDFSTFGDDPIPSWIKAIQDNEEGLDERMLPDAWSSRGLAKMANAAQACTDCPKPPRRDRYRPKELLAMARAALISYNATAFENHRAKCRIELSTQGEVVSGLCSCTAFVPNH